MQCVTGIYCILVFILSTFCVASPDSCSDPLECFLNSIVIVVPNTCFDVSGTEFCMNDFRCQGIYIESIDSSYNYDAPTTLGMGVTDMATSCDGLWSYGRMGGELDAIVNNTSVNIDLLIAKNASNMVPISTTFEVCEIPDIDINLIFKGGITSAVLDAVSPLIERALEAAINGVICTGFGDYFAVNVTNTLIEVVDPKLVEITSSAPSIPPPIPEEEVDDFINWNDSIFAIINDIMNKDNANEMSSSVDLDTLTSCLTNNSMSNDIRNYTINTLIDIVTDDTGAIELPLNVSLGNMSLTSITISGLDTFSTVDILVPSDVNNQTLDIDIVLDELQFDIGIMMDFGEAYYENITFRIHTSNITLSMDLLLAINKTSVTTLYLDQFFNTSCSLTAVDYFNISSLIFSVDIDDIVVIQLGGIAGDLEDDIVALINNAMLLLTNGYNDLITAVFEGLAQGPIREGINSMVDAKGQELRETQECRDHVSNPNTELISWANSTVVALIDTIVNDMVGPKGLNELFICVTNNTGSISIFNITNEYTRLTLSGLVSWYDLSVLYPMPDISPYTLGNLVGLGNCSKVDELYDDGDSIRDTVMALCGPLMIAVEGNFILPDVGYEYVNTQAALSHVYNSLGGFVNTVLYGDALSPVVENYPIFHTATPTASPTTLTTAVPSSAGSSVPSAVTAVPSSAGSSVPSAVTAVPSSAGSNRASSSRLSETLDIFAEAIAKHKAGLSYNLAHLSRTQMLGVGSPDAVPTNDTNALIEIEMGELDLFLDFYLAVNSDAISDLQLSEVTTTGCMGSTVDSMSITNLSITVDSMWLYLKNESMGRNITEGVQAIFDKLASPARIDARNEEISTSLSQASATCENGGVDPFSGDVSDSNLNSDWKWQMALLACGCVFALFSFLFIYARCGKYRKQRGCIAMMGFGEGIQFDEDGNVIEGEEDAIDRFWKKYDLGSALVFHDDLPMWLRVGVPFSILFTVGLFLNSNLDPNAVLVQAELYIGDQVISPPPVFAFGLSGTVSDMWDAKVYALAILIAFFSGAWPYVKLFSMLAMWCLPTTIVSTRGRENVLIWLDILGKWSLIDVNVMVMMMVAFYFTLDVGDEIEVVVNVLAKFGFLGFLLATMISLGLGHIVLAGHRVVVDPKINLDARKTYESVMSHQFDGSTSFYYKPTGTTEQSEVSASSQGRYSDYLSDTNSDSEDGSESERTSSRKMLTEALNPSPEPSPDMSTSSSCTSKCTPNQASSATSSCGLEKDVAENETEKISPRKMLLKYTTFGKVFVLLSIVVTATFVVIGTFMNTFNFEFLGLVGFMLKDTSDVEYGYVQVSDALPDASGDPNGFSVRWVQVSYLLFGIVMPLCLLTLLIALWTIPMSLPTQKQLFTLAEILNAWTALDVFCVSIAAALLELQQFAQFIVGDSCDELNARLAEYMEENELDGEAKCFDVIAKLKTESWTIFLAAFLLFVVCVPLLLIMQQVIEERLENESCTADDRALRKSQSYGHSRSNMAPFNKEYADYMKVEILNNDEVLVNADGTINHSSDINPANVAAGTDAHKNIEKEPSIAWIRFIKMVVSLGVMEYCPPPEQVEAM